jgi:hypothetical protein
VTPLFAPLASSSRAARADFRSFADRDAARYHILNKGLTSIVLIFAILVSEGITRPVRRLPEGTRSVEAGRLDGSHRGIIDKYIGDAIMAYWGPPFIDEADQARFACFAAIDMIGRIATLRKELPELLGARTIHRYRRGNL